MKKKYEVEIQRRGISPRQFFSYCRREMKKRADVDLSGWCESYEEWSRTDNPYSNRCFHEDWDKPALEICHTEAFNWQFFLGGAYNFIMEFQFDTENSGVGYMFAVEYET